MFKARASFAPVLATDGVQKSCRDWCTDRGVVGIPEDHDYT